MTQLNVFPVREGSKAPAIKGWAARAAPLPTWLQEFPGHVRWGAPAGETNGWWVLDVDPRHGGDLSLCLLQERYGALPVTYVVRTPSGGFHYYFSWSSLCVELTNTAGKLGAGLDIRAEGGMVLVPPTQGYEVMSNESPAEAPTWLLALLMPPAGSTQRVKGDDAPIRNPMAWGSRAIASALEEIRAAPEGTRDATMNRNAYGMGRLIEPCGLEADRVIETLVDAAIAAGYNAHKALDCCRRAVHDGMRNPREAAAAVAPAAVQAPGERRDAEAPVAVDQLRPCPPKPGAAPADPGSAAGLAWAAKQAEYSAWQNELHLHLGAKLVTVRYDQARVLYRRRGLRRLELLGAIDAQTEEIRAIGAEGGLLVTRPMAEGLVHDYLSRPSVVETPTLWDTGSGFYRWESPKVEAGPTPTWDAILARISDPVAFLAHVWSAFEPRFKGRQVLWLQGEGNDGKSILFGAIFEGAGVPFAAVNDDDLQRGSQFLFSSIWDRPAVLVGDSKSVNLMMLGVIHRLTGRDYLGVEYKHGQRFNAKFGGVVFVASNQRPQIEASRSNLSRLSFITLQPGDWVDDLAFRLRSEVPALLARAREAYAVACPRHFDIALSARSLELLGESTGADHEKHAASLFNAGLRIEGDGFIARKDIVVRLNGKLDDGKLASFYRWLEQQPGVRAVKVDGIRGFKGLAS